MATRYTYDDKKDTYKDFNASFGQGEANRIKKEYPEKMKKNDDVAKKFPPAKAITDVANKKLAQDLGEISAAEAASAVSRGKKNPKGVNKGDL